MKCTLIALFVALLLVACGPTQVVVIQPTPTVIPCTRALYIEALGDIISRWDDANALASSTPRMGLAAQIAVLQSIRREAEALNIPDCTTVAHGHLIEYMNQTIEGYTGFMADRPCTPTVDCYTTNLARADIAFDQWQQSMDQLPSGIPTPTQGN